MEEQFWHERWQNEQIGFHEGNVNRHLEAWWQTLKPAAGETVFVPLCGKAHDLAWLRGLGHRVIGVELSELACQGFFAEHGREPEVEAIGSFLRHHYDGIELWCGDFFQLTPAQLPSIDLFYDRAALIALPPAMRRDYARHLIHLLPSDSRGLLITLDYPEQADFQGPPFNVSDAEVRELYGSTFDVEPLYFGALPADDGLHKRALKGGTESVFSLHRRRN